MARKIKAWTNRQVRFDPLPRQNPEKWETFFDALPDYFWGWRQRIYRTMGISSSHGVVTVGGWPFWVPRWYAMRQVAKVALRCNIGGDITFVTELVVDHKPDDEDTRLSFEHIKGIWEARDGVPDWVHVHQHEQNPEIAEQVFGPIDQATIDLVHEREAMEELPYFVSKEEEA